MSDFLPDILTLEDFNGDFQKLKMKAYSVFQHDFKNTRPYFYTNPIRLKSGLDIDGMEPSFWHVISDGPDESKRTIDLDRIARVPWIAPIITNFRDSNIRWYEDSRKGKKSTVLWYVPGDYLVVLEHRNKSLLLQTAYIIKYESKRKKIEKTYQAYLKSKGRSPQGGAPGTPSTPGR